MKNHGNMRLADWLMGFAAAFLLPVLAWAGPAVASIDDRLQEKSEALLALRELDRRVATVGYRLARANVDLCSQQVPLAGIVPHDVSQYDASLRSVAAGIFNLEAGPAVLAVAQGSPAHRAGILADDRLIAINGQPSPGQLPSNDSASFESAEQILGWLEGAFGQEGGEMQVERDRQFLTIVVKTEQGCRTRFQLLPSRSFGASADGHYVQITSRLALFAANDGELAAILAHELAHNILTHRKRLDDAGIKRGLLKFFGRNARLIRQTEVEADRLSVYLLDRAGFPPTAAAQLWRRLGPRRPWGIIGASTHPNWKKRVAALENEAARIQALKRSGAVTVLPAIAVPAPLDP